LKFDWKEREGSREIAVMGLKERIDYKFNWWFGLIDKDVVLLQRRNLTFHKKSDWMARRKFSDVFRLRLSQKLNIFKQQKLWQVKYEKMEMVSGGLFLHGDDVTAKGSNTIWAIWIFLVNIFGITPWGRWLTCRSLMYVIFMAVNINLTAFCNKKENKWRINYFLYILHFFFLYNIVFQKKELI